MNDSIPLGPKVPDGISMETSADPDSISRMRTDVEYRYEYSPASASHLRYGAVHDTNLRIHGLHFTPGQSSLFNWNSGEIVASGGTRVFPGLMQIDSGALGINQTAGNFGFYFGAMVNNYGYYNGLYTQYGLNGRITWQFSPKLSATVFGNYYFGQPARMADGKPMSPAIIGYYGRTTVGGYLDYSISERWGVQAGAQTVQQVGTGRYEVEPIVTPYYKISKKVAIGLPVGQILYHILK